MALPSGPLQSALTGRFRAYQAAYRPLRTKDAAYGGSNAGFAKSLIEMDREHTDAFTAPSMVLRDANGRVGSKQPLTDGRAERGGHDGLRPAKSLRWAVPLYASSNVDY